MEQNETTNAIPSAETDFNMMYCVDCGYKYSRKATACPRCGSPSPFAKGTTATSCGLMAEEGKGKSRILYIILGFFFGQWGIHNFYTGYTGQGLAKLLLGFLVITIPFMWLWAIYEIITVKVDAKGNPLV